MARPRLHQDGCRASDQSGRRIGVERLVAVQEDLALEVQQLDRFEGRSGKFAVGGLNAVDVGQRFDQSERTMTTLLAGMAASCGQCDLWLTTMPRRRNSCVTRR